MLRITDLDNFPAGRAALTVGNFDGCHIGHRRLVDATRALADELGAVSTAMSFWPRPDAFFREACSPPRLLFTEAQKSRALAELGLAVHHAQRFDESFGALSPGDFYLRLAHGKARAAAFVVGYDFRFGYRREGTLDFLRSIGSRDGLRVAAFEAQMHDEAPISSTRIRAALADAGDVEAAAVMLGRPYMLEGVVTRGDQLGRTLGVPTTNLEGVEQLVPRFGVYAGWVAFTGAPRLTTTDQAAIPAVFSIGIRPTLDAARPPLRIEAHLLAGQYAANEHYGQPAGYYLTHRLRDELKLSSLEELKTWMARDIAEARSKLGVGG